MAKLLPLPVSGTEIVESPFSMAHMAHAESAEGSPGPRRQGLLIIDSYEAHIPLLCADECQYTGEHRSGSGWHLGKA